MKKITLVFAVFILIISCGRSTQDTMTVTGKVKGLKKGTLYLQKFNDNSLITIDSVEAKGDGSFTFKTAVKNPELFNLYLNKEDHNDFNDRISFFGESGVITIDTSWDNFDHKATISGSESNEKFQEYRSMMSKFNIKTIEIAQNAQNVAASLNSAQIDSIQKLSDLNVKKSYAYALNFALRNTNSTIAPYIAVYEVPDANRKYLDSIYSSLEEEISSSKYGKELQKHLQKLPK